MVTFDEEPMEEHRDEQDFIYLGEQKRERLKEKSKKKKEIRW